MNFRGLEIGDYFASDGQTQTQPLSIHCSNFYTEVSYWPKPFCYQYIYTTRWNSFKTLKVSGAQIGWFLEILRGGGGGVKGRLENLQASLTQFHRCKNKDSKAWILMLGMWVTRNSSTILPTKSESHVSVLHLSIWIL